MPEKRHSIFFADEQKIIVSPVAWCALDTAAGKGAVTRWIGSDVAGIRQCDIHYGRRLRSRDRISDVCDACKTGEDMAGGLAGRNAR